MEAQSRLPGEGQADVPDVGQMVLLHVPGRPTPIDAVVTAVTQHGSRPPSLSLRIQVPGLGVTNLVLVEHVSLGNPFGGWELKD